MDVRTTLKKLSIQCGRRRSVTEGEEATEIALDFQSCVTREMKVFLTEELVCREIHAY